MNKKALSVLIAVVMLVSVVPAAVQWAPVTAASPGTSGDTVNSATKTPSVSGASNFVPGDQLLKEIRKIMASHKKTVRLIVAPDREHAMDVYKALSELGRIDPISKPEYQFIVVTMPITRVPELENIPGILHVWEDRTVKLEEPVPPEEGIEGLPSKEKPKTPDMFMSIFTINAYDAWMNYGVYGDDVVVAVLDTGVDVAHPFLQTTLDGRPKIVDIFDASDEGIAQLFAVSAPVDGVITVNRDVTLYMGYYSDLYYGHSSKYKTYTLTSYTVGNIAGDTYYIGALPERYFDMNFDGDKDDVYPVLVVNSSNVYTAYIDTDMDNNFTDETPMGLFDDTGDYAVFEGTLVTVAFARVNIGDMNNPENYPYYVPYGDGDGYAMFMWDAHGHGTHVSGTVAGVGLPDDPVFSGVYGVAPNAQLMEVKVLPGEQGFGRTSWIINGMFYAAMHGADVISMSLGGGGEINDGIESPENYYVNLLTDLFGVTFAIAAGNEGPSTNTVHSPGTSDLAITVGNYVDNERESYWYGVDLGVISGPSMSSSRGPRDDGMLDPDVMAPGTDIFSSLPMWYTVLEDDPYYYYGIWSGTSMATPHVSGAVALMISYAKAHGLSYNPIMIRRALEMSAKPVNGTLIDQGFGLIQVDKAIETLEQLSQEPTTYIFAGTTYTGFKNPIGVPTIPISQAYVDFNGYFQNMFGLPYLYRGVYIRNEYPGSVPVYFSPMIYAFDPYFTHYTVFFFLLENKVYKISTNVDWIIPNTTEVTINGADAVNGDVVDVSKLIGQFSINIDYNKLGKSGVYVGLVYIDDPDTSYIDGYVPVVVEIPLNKNGETHVKFSDTEKPGEAKHYFVKVPRGTKELRVTLRVPADANGVPMGRTKLVIARPLGGVVYDGVPEYYYVGANPAGYLYEYTWVVENPVEGTWEITAYSSTFTKYYSGYDTSHYEIEVSMGSVSIEPELIRKDLAQPACVTVQATVSNSYGDFNASAIGYGVGRMDESYAMLSSVGQDEWDVIGVVAVDPSTYFIRFGITEPEDPNADLDLYVYYFPTYEDYVNFQNYVEYYDQIGPTSDEVFERFMPEPGYYLIAVYGYDTVGYNPIDYVFYYQVLGDNGNVSVDSTPFKFVQGTSRSIEATVGLNSEGTYLGVMGLINSDTGETLTYAPMIFQVGQPEMLVLTSGKAVLGQESRLQIWILNKTSMELVDEPVTVIVNGQPYYTINGKVNVTFIPTSFDPVKFEIQAVSETFKDVNKIVELQVQEPVDSVIERADAAKVFLAGSGTLVTKKPKVTLVQFNDGYSGAIYTVTATGPTGERGYILLAMPVNAKISQFKKDKHVVDYWVLKGKKAKYLLVEVEYASSVTLKVTIKLEPTRLQPNFNVFNFLYNRWYQNKVKEFNELYQKALEAGVNETILQKALAANQTAAEYYQKALDLAGGNLLLHLGDFRVFAYLRNAYIAESTAVRILKEALGE